MVNKTHKEMFSHQRNKWKLRQWQNVIYTLLNIDKVLGDENSHTVLVGMEPPWRAIY